MEFLAEAFINSLIIILLLIFVGLIGTSIYLVSHSWAIAISITTVIVLVSVGVAVIKK
jgi:hypothetical protein